MDSSINIKYPWRLSRKRLPAKGTLHAPKLYMNCIRKDLPENVSRRDTNVVAVAVQLTDGII